MPKPLAYYSENDPYAAAWLRNLIDAGHIAPGDVDERSIREVQPDDVRGYRQCHFFAGIGGWSVALRMAGWPDDRPVWTGSCPCQPFSAAGKNKGHADDRHLWPDFFRLIRERRPDVVFGEQVEGAVGHGWLDGICADLESEGYAVGSVVLGAHSVGAPHIRQRLWWVADAVGERHERIDSLLREGDESRRFSSAPPETSGCGLDHDAISAGLGSEVIRHGHPDYERFCRRYGGGLGHASRGGDGSVPFTGGDSEGEGEGRECGVGGPSSSSGVADRRGAGLEIDGEQQTWTERQAVERSRTSDFWSRYTLVPCRDGKGRRVKPGLEPLAHGVSGRVAVRRTVEQAGTTVQEEHLYSRVGALKGFGNAIVPEVAAEFITAYCDLSASPTETPLQEGARP